MKHFVLFIFAFPSFLIAQISIDGIYDDWENITTIIEDQDGHQGLDILSLSITNDAENLYLKIETDRVFDLQDDEAISIFIDADNQSSTGFQANGLGSEITYYFGNRSAFINYPNSTFNGNHDALRLIALPTITSNVFEIAIKRRLETSLGVMTMGSVISISVENGNSGDVVPNASGGTMYTMQDNVWPPLEYDLAKQSPNFKRVVSYNVLNDAFLDPARESEVKAILKGINPDIIAFQEVYSTPMEDIASFLSATLPNDDGSSWQYAKEGPDVAVFTRYYMEAHNQIDGNGIFLLYDDDNNPMIIYNVHLPCCDRDVDRQLEIDRILSVLRDKEQAPEVNFLYEKDTPIIITGDFNMVGLAQNNTSFLEGDIVNENLYGADFNPDWDGSNMEDANPYVTGFPSNYTWKRAGSSYNPGKLDLLYYTGSVMTKQNAYVLDTEFLSEEELSFLGVNRDATRIASDHLPLVIDFSFGIVDEDMDGFAADVDCDDNNAAINPDAVEIVNNDIDEDCDGIAQVIDEDMDGFNSDEDCNDTNAAINPDAAEIVNNDIDEDCDGIAQVIDEDMDGFNSDEDCDDTNAAINPDAVEIVNNDIDEDCDGVAQMIDEDMDGYNSDEDCNDLDSLINPGALEIPNNDVDENCDGTLMVIDNDMDGFNSDEDCNDMDSLINPGVMEIPNNDIDEDCDGIILIIDEDMDGFNSDEDCNDMDSLINPGVMEIPNNDIDEDCDGTILIIDEDMDGFNSDEDCNDLDSLINPNAMEIPNNGIDEDCDGMDLTTSVDDVRQLEVKIYPNPIENDLWIDILGSGLHRITIYNSSGLIIYTYQTTVKKSRINFRDYPNGVYFIKITNKDQLSMIKKVIK